MTSRSKDPSATPGGAIDPQQVAVALKHEKRTTDAPRVVATGRGAVAEQIIQIAFANGVRVREDADLVELLSAIENDSEIPLAAFAAVAEILAYVYRANAEAGSSNAGSQEPT